MYTADDSSTVNILYRVGEGCDRVFAVANGCAAEKGIVVTRLVFGPERDETTLRVASSYRGRNMYIYTPPVYYDDDDVCACARGCVRYTFTYYVYTRRA